MTEANIRAVRPTERRTALRWSLAAPRQTAADLEYQVNGFIEYAQSLRLSYHRQFIAEADGRPIAACTCITWPGRTGMIMIGPGGTPALETTLVQLLRHALSAARDDDIRLYQALLPPGDSALHAVMLAGGFIDLSVLHYLEKAVGPSDAAMPAQPRGINATDVAIETFDERQLLDWRSLVLATYDGSQDCPELAGLRQIDDILAGHRAAGHFAPHRWLMLRHRANPAAVLMLSENPLRPALEIVYTGVHPAMRGKGLGQFLVRTALATALAEGFSAVTLAVDERNRPARAIYDAAGFEFTGARRAMIRPMPASTS